MNGSEVPGKRRAKVPWVRITVTLVIGIFLLGTLNILYLSKERIEKLIVLQHGEEALRTGSPYSSKAPSKEEGMVYIPGGTFVMGNATGNPDERPPYKVKVASFYLDETLVTNKAYKKFLEATGHKAPPHWKNGTYPKGEDDLPVFYVSWYDANAFAHWAGKRLPTEEEWEYAARGGKDYLWPWGNQWDDRKGNANYYYNGVTAVKRFPQGRNAYGLYDMAGNLFQWTSSPYKRYPGNTLEEWYYIKGLYVIRGGSWKSDIYSAKVSRRNAIPPESIADFIGFRCAKDAFSSSRGEP